MYLRFDLCVEYATRLFVGGVLPGLREIAEGFQ